MATGTDRADQDAIIAGRNPVREALERGETSIEKVMIQQGAGGRPIEQIQRAATASGIPIQYVPQTRLTQVAGGANHQGVVAISAPVSYVELEDMLNTIAVDIDAVRAKIPVLLMLDQIEDPHNFGAILRSAVAFGIQGVIVPKHHMAPLNTVAIKTSAGAALRIPIARVTNLTDAIEQLKERGYWIVGATGSGTTPLTALDLGRPVVIVIGSEGKGLRPRVEKACDYRVSIPLVGPVESLNASVAAGILLWSTVLARFGQEK